jgi:hypothetical protein
MLINMATQLRHWRDAAMKDEQKSGLQLAPGILRAALRLGLLLGIVMAPLPAQLSMGRPGLTRVPAAKKRTPVATRPAGGSISDADKRLAEAIKNLSSKDRKKLNKAMKRMRPAQRLIPRRML